MTRKEIESIYHLKREVEMWEYRLEEMQADISISAKAMDGMPFANTNAVSNPTEAKAIKLSELDKNIKKQINKLNSKIAAAELFIMQVDDSEMRQLLEYRCILLLTWPEIADIMGYDRTTLIKRYQNFWNSKTKAI